MSISLPEPLRNYGALAGKFLQSYPPYYAYIDNAVYGSSNP